MNVTMIKEYKYSENGNEIKIAAIGNADLPERFARKAMKSGHAKAIKPSRNKSAAPKRSK